jgi:hypothetical protein
VFSFILDMQRIQNVCLKYKIIRTFQYFLPAAVCGIIWCFAYMHLESTRTELYALFGSLNILNGSKVSSPKYIMTHAIICQLSILYLRKRSSTFVLAILFSPICCDRCRIYLFVNLSTYAAN